MTGLMTLDELRTAVADGGIDTVLVCFPDMYGRLIGKRFDAGFYCEGAHEETHACNYLLANDIDMEPVPGFRAASWEQGYGDFAMKPIAGTLRRIPWLDSTALVLCDLADHHGHDIPHAPRTLLKAQCTALEDVDVSAMFASELEFYLFTETWESAREKRWENLKTASGYMQDYHILATTREEAVMQQVRRGLSGAGIPVENSKGEWGPGQEEINVRYCDALTMADRHVILKNGIKEMAHQLGWAVTFMAKWHYDYAGSSCHVHASLWDKAGSKPLFFDAGAEHGMSPLMRQFMAGQLKYAADCTYFLAPFINSYKRFQQAGTFAPTRIVWSDDNRTAGFRLCGAGTRAIRTECRIGGADLNPYLAFAALLAAGLAGVREQLDLPPAFHGDAYATDSLREIPKTLREATGALEASTMLRAAFGSDVVDHYVHAARWEQAEYDRRITDWELKRGFERY
ncbi:MAG: glutamine synthetase [Pseudomonadales bacterium]|nr:glutamine synthetase [Pseudomonadales bacterium]MCP5182596.1 glutamine synthetase [Pseudomonadales bacterium]